MVEWARGEDRDGRLERFLEVLAPQPALKQQCVAEEGWILGVE
jgi:hypothetical protein